MFSEEELERIKQQLFRHIDENFPEENILAIFVAGERNK